MLATKCWVYNIISIGNGQYTATIYFDSFTDSQYIKQNDVLRDAKGDRYRILTWNGFPNNFNNEGTVTLQYLTNDVLIQESITISDAEIYTEGELDIRPELYSPGQLFASDVHNTQLSQFKITAMWDSVDAANNAQVGDYIADSIGKLYKIIEFGATRWTDVIVEEVDKENTLPTNGSGFLFKPTQNFDLYFGGKLNDNQLMKLMNRDNFLIDYYASVGGKGGAGIFILDVVPTNTGIVADKTYKEETVPTNVNLATAISDTNQIRVIVGMNGDGETYSPTAEINEVSVVLEETSTKRWFVGYADIPIVAGNNFIQAIASTGSIDTAWVELAGPGPNVLTATFGSYPGSQTELKENDVIDINITTEISASEVMILAGGAAKYTVILPVMDGNASGQITVSGLSGNQTVTLVAKNSFGTSGEDFITSALVLNQIHPTIGDITFTYPSGQGAFGDGQSGSLNATVTNFDSINYTSSHFTITDPTVYNATKNILNTHTGYVNSGTNVTITAIKTSNGAITTRNGLGIIATVAPTAAISIIGNPARLMSSVTGNDYTIVITPNQILSQAPDLDASIGSWQGNWSFVSNTWRRDLRITDDDPKGSGLFTNLEVIGLSTLIGSTITSGENYTVGGFVNRNITFPAFQRGAFIGTFVVDQTKTSAQVVGGNVLTRYEDNTIRQNGYYIGDSSFNYDATGSYICLSDSDFAGSNTTGTLQVSIQEDV